jgi:hypothetical protein
MALKNDWRTVQKILNRAQGLQKTLRTVSTNGTSSHADFWS